MSGAFLVALGPTQTHAARIDADGAVEVRPLPRDATEPEFATTASEVAGALADLGYNGSGICLGLRARDVLVASVDTEGLPRKGRDEALLYRLEEHLPVDAEGLTAAFLPAVGGRALGVAADTERLKALVEALEAAGVATAAISPTALLALRDVFRDSAARCDFVFLACDGRLDVFRTADGQVSAWHVGGTEAADAVRAVQAELLVHPAESQPPTATVLGHVDEDVLGRLCHDTGLKMKARCPGTVLEAAARSAARLLDGEGGGWVNLRRGALAEARAWGPLAAPLKAAVWLMVAVLVGASAAAYGRAARYAAARKALVGEQERVHAGLFPAATTVPLSIGRHLEAEAQRLGGIIGAAGSIPAQASALENLRRTVAALPAEMHVRITELRIDPMVVHVEGQTRSHADADAVARALGESAGFAMEAPRTERLVRRGVAFTLIGKPAGAGPAAGPPKGGT